MDYPGIDGFLGTRASFMLDVVFLAMFVVVPVMGWSIYQVKYRRRYLLHKRVQLSLALVLLVAVTLFEADMRIHGWQQRATPSPYFSAESPYGWANVALWIHLCFAVTTAILWIVVTIGALRKFPSPPQPSAHSPTHMLLGKLAAIDMACTAITGWVFYYLAFAAV